MVRFLLLAVALLMFAMVALTLIISALIFVALACAVGIPLYLLSRSWLAQRGVTPGLHPMDRLKSLYVEGKIDLFEFERRVAHLIAVER